MASLSAIPVRSLRFPGGTIGDNYDWRSAKTMRADWFPFNYKSSADDLNFDEFMLVAKCLGAQPTIVLNLRSWLAGGDIEGAMREAEDWVKYANIEKGYAIRYWEFGNELYHNQPQRQSPLASADYGKYYAALRARLKQIDPAVELGMVMPNEPGQVVSNDTTPWWDGALAGAGNQVDFIVLHKYSAPNWRQLLRAGSGMGEVLAVARSYLKGKTGRDVPIHVTEWNIGSKSAGNPGKIKPDSAGHALFVADGILDLADSDVRYANFWPLFGSKDTGLLDRKSLVLNAPGLVMQLFAPLSGARISPVAGGDSSGLQLRRFDLPGGQHALVVINWQPSFQEVDWRSYIGDCRASARLIQPEGEAGAAELDAGTSIRSVAELAPGTVSLPGLSVTVVSSISCGQ